MDTHTIPDPGEPTGYPAGSLGKIAVLAARAARDEPLFHAGDNPVLGRLSRADTGPPGTAVPAGVSRHGGRWRARVCVRGRGQVYVGLFDDAGRAAEAVKVARRRMQQEEE
jgi:hypothetical protein